MDLLASFPSEATEVVVCSVNLEVESMPLPAAQINSEQALPPKFNENELAASAVITELDDSAAGTESSNKTATIASI